MQQKPSALAIQGMVDTCPHCGYTDGFHVSFNQKNATVWVVLICPNCHYRYDPGWVVNSLAR